MTAISDARAWLEKWNDRCVTPYGKPIIEALIADIEARDARIGELEGALDSIINDNGHVHNHDHYQNRIAVICMVCVANARRLLNGEVGS